METDAEGHPIVNFHHHVSVSGAPRTVAIAGATGQLGPHLVSAILSPPFAQHISELILLSRHPPKDVTLPMPPAGIPTKVSARQYNVAHQGSIIQALDGVDVLVSSLGHGPAVADFESHLLAAIPRTDVQAYFPSEYGVDHYTHTFSHPLWDQKRAHMAAARRILKPAHVSVVRLFTGVFLEGGVGPWLGYDSKHAHFESIGSAGDGHTSFTALDDIGRAIASLAAFAPDLRALPSALHIAGDTRTVAEVARIMADAGGGDPENDGKITVSEMAWEPFHNATISRGETDPNPYLRFLMGENKIDHSPGSKLGCENELVNPGERLWKWKTLTDLARETHGKPFPDAEYPPAHHGSTTHHC